MLSARLHWEKTTGWVIRGPEALTGASQSLASAPFSVADFNLFPLIVTNCKCECKYRTRFCESSGKSWSLKTVLGAPRHKCAFIESVDSDSIHPECQALAQAPPTLLSLLSSTPPPQTSQLCGQRWPGSYRGHLSNTIHLPPWKNRQPL